jgi:hypothetical protein
VERRILVPESVDLDEGDTIFVFDADIDDKTSPQDIKIYRALFDDVASQWDKDRKAIELPINDQLVEGSQLYVKWVASGKTHQRIVEIKKLLTDPISGAISATLMKALPDTAHGQTQLIYRLVSGADSQPAETRLAVRLDAPVTLGVPKDQVLVEVNQARHTLLHVIANRQVLVTDGAPIDQANVAAGLVIAFGGQTSYPPPRPRNPELSWEYWDGQSWWQIPGVTDTTGHLVSSGEVVFTVPASLQANDVVGRKNHWVRARLIGGDYGQESITLISSPRQLQANKDQKQTVTRDSSGIRAPYIVTMQVRYALCETLHPDIVLTLDGGGYRDQTDANGALNAKVRAFTPLKYSLPRTGARIAAPGPDADCGCDGDETPTVLVTITGCEDEAPATPAAAADPNAETGRAIYLGFDKPLQGASIAILFIVNDGEHDGAFPLLVEAFTDDGFGAVSVEDETRGLSQTGIVTMSLPKPLQEARLFGQLLHWLRLKPRTDSDPALWKPQLRAIYLNAAFAAAAETQRQEILGSSDGSPDQSVFVARPPVLQDSLELRICEPLDDEELDALNEIAVDTVKAELGPWKGAWVRWRAATLASAGATERVFELLSDTGEIMFGDGRHGAIPPIGQNNIVAVTYQRGGGDAANTVPAWGQLSLITPIAGVEATIAPEAAAGGAGEQNAETAMRFAPDNLKMQNRALTLGDIEMLALQSSPEIAQVKALRSPQGVRVIQIMRGFQPRPSNAQRRELARLIIERAPPALSVPGALTIEAPRIVAGAMALELTVSDLANAGAVAKEAIRRVGALLDPATGGIEGYGWPLGAVPDEADVAECLIGIAELVDVANVQITSSVPLRPIELFVVDESSIVVTSKLDAEVTV